MSVAAHDVLRFEVSGEEFGVALPLVEEIVEYRDVTPVPGASPWIRGIFNLRGRVVPVVDLAVRIGMEPRPVGKRSVFVISKTALGSEVVHMALVVDLVRDVVSAGEVEQEALPPFGLGLKVGYIDSVLRSDDRYVKVLRLDRVFGEAIVPHEEAEDSSTRQGMEKPSETGGQSTRPQEAAADSEPPTSAVASQETNESRQSERSSQVMAAAGFQVVEVGEGIFVFEDDEPPPTGLDVAATESATTANKEDSGDDESLTEQIPDAASRDSEAA
jgi:purine-binding chemotaxis protein CheW